MRGAGGHQECDDDDVGDGIRSRRQREQTGDALRVITGARGGCPLGMLQTSSSRVEMLPLGRQAALPELGRHQALSKK